MPKLIDCFLYHNEIELLQIRLRLLAPHVHRFVIVWSSETFTGRKKEDPFPWNDAIVAAHRDRIELVTIDKLPDGSAWDKENHSRNLLARGLDGAEADDLLLISDIDELPRPDVLHRLRDTAPAGPRVLAQDYYNFKFNFQLVYGMQAVWPGPILCSKRDFTTPQILRAGRWAHMYDAELCIPEAGWHFSFLARGGDVTDKLRSYAHQEHAVQARRDDVGELLAARQGFHDHVEPCSVWAVVDLASFGCPELEALVREYPRLLYQAPPDDETLVRRRIKLSAYRMKTDERVKMLPWFSFAELRHELWRRIKSRISA